MSTLTKPQTEALIRFCSGTLNWVNRPDPRVIRSLLRLGMIHQDDGLYYPTAVGIEHVKSLKTKHLSERIRVPKHGVVSELLQSIINPMPHEKWVMEVAKMMDHDLAQFEAMSDRVLKVASYYSYQARANTLNRYLVSSTRDCLTVLQVRKLFHSYEPRLL